ncbi:MAG: universal stress protein [Polyangiaceae bacterium]
MFNHILVATDFSDCSKRAIDLAVGLAEKLEARLTLTHAWELPNFGYGSELYLPSDLLTPFEEAAQARLDEALLAVKARLPRATSILRPGAPWQQILKAAELVGADLIVVGTHGRRGLNHALLGSVAERVVRMAEIPVLTAHGA